MNFCLAFTFLFLLSTSLAYKNRILEEDPHCVDQETDLTWPYPGDCTKYYECYRGEKYARDCPDGTWFHPEYLECVFPGDFCDNSNSTTTWSTETSTTTPQPTTTSTQEPTTSTTLTTTPPTTTTEPTTTPTTSTQELTTSTSTAEPTTTPTQEPTTLTAQTTTTSDPNDGKDPRCIDNETTYWSHPEYCHLYIECYHGNSYEMICPRGLFFSEKLQECVDAHLSECCVTPSDCQ